MATKRIDIKNIFRTKEWLVTKLIFNMMLGLSYWVWTGSALKDFIVPLGLIIWYILTVGSFGYFLNDLFDRNADLKAGKDNAGKHIPAGSSLLILAALLFLASVPFIFILEDFLTYLIMLAFHVLLLLSYSIPYLRLKKNTGGLFLDSFYSFIWPALISFFLCSQFSTIAQNSIMHFLFVFLWLFFLGLRSILHHQLDDYEADQKSMIRTFCIATGKKACTILFRAILLLEILSLIICFALWFTPLGRAAVVAIPLFIVVEMIIKRKDYQKGFWVRTAVQYNVFYNFYLINGLFIILALSTHFWLLLVPVFFIAVRLHFFQWIYYKPVLWFYHKCTGAGHRLKR